MTDALVEPNACAHCDIGRDDHLQRWAPGVRWHTWVAPTDAQRKARLLARRAAPPANQLTTRGK